MINCKQTKDLTVIYFFLFFGNLSYVETRIKKLYGIRMIYSVLDLIVFFYYWIYG